MDTKISIIIPVYNPGPFLQECVDSILRQTLPAWELILVDDGSTDGSGDICDSLAAHDSRIKVVHIPNGGPSKARNAGLDRAEADIITFIDSDDIISPLYLEKMLESMRKKGADVSCSMIRVTPNPSIASFPPFSDSSYCLSGREAAELSLYQKKGMDSSPCAKLYNKGLWEGVRFKEGIIYEDLDILYLILLKARKVAVCEDIMYLYRVNPSSLLHVFNKRRLDVLDVTDRIIRKAENEYPFLLPAAHDRALSASFNMLGLMPPDDSLYKEYVRKCRHTIIKYRRETLFNRRSRLKNRMASLVSYILGMNLTTLLLRRFYK